MAKGWSCHKGGKREQCASRSNTSAMAKLLRLGEEAPAHIKGLLTELCLSGSSKRKGRESGSGFAMYKDDGNGGVMGFRRQNLTRKGHPVNPASEKGSII